jgi:alkyl hydroperoxide reductase subunit F
MIYDVIILGGGPAGVAAGIYAARKKLKAVLITSEFGGQSVVSDNIENWVGTLSISGVDLAKNLEQHLRAQSGIQIKVPEKISQIKKNKKSFLITTDRHKYETKTVILATGARRRKLNVPGEKELDGKGVVYCSTCDAPLFADKLVAVVGGGNSGLEAVQDLIPYANQIYLFTNIGSLTGDPITVEEIKKSGKLKSIIYNSEILEILGDKFVSGLKYRDKQTNQNKNLDVQGVFVEIGALPNSEIVKDLVDLNKWGEVIINHQTAATSCPGIWAAGDITDEAYKQNNISAGDGVKAALSAYNYLLKHKD